MNLQLLIQHPCGKSHLLNVLTTNLTRKVFKNINGHLDPQQVQKYTNKSQIYNVKQNHGTIN